MASSKPKHVATFC